MVRGQVLPVGGTRNRLPTGGTAWSGPCSVGVMTEAPPTVRQLEFPRLDPVVSETLAYQLATVTLWAAIEDRDERESRPKPPPLWIHGLAAPGSRGLVLVPTTATSPAAATPEEGVTSRPPPT